MDPKSAQPLSIFGFPLRTWAEFCVIKLLADLAEILQVEDLLHCSFHPLRNLARVTMPEEKFHAQFGRDFCTELVRTDDGRRAVQDAIDRYFPLLPGFFGASGSKNNERLSRIPAQAADQRRDARRLPGPRAGSRRERAGIEAARRRDAGGLTAPLRREDPAVPATTTRRPSAGHSTTGSPDCT